LFVLVGRQTFSAGNMMAIELEKYTEATFVGEASGGSVQGFGNHEPVFLPNSGLGVMIATKFYQNDGPNDDRPAIAPTIAALLTARDYAEGRDPALAAALAYGATPSRARPSPARR
jgi:C-terminal processing protease CtpA/Prc